MASKRILRLSIAALIILFGLHFFLMGRPRPSAAFHLLLLFVYLLAWSSLLFFGMKANARKLLILYQIFWSLGLITWIFLVSGAGFSLLLVLGYIVFSFPFTETIVAFSLYHIEETAPLSVYLLLFLLGLFANRKVRK